jgi:hypothetical protein
MHMSGSVRKRSIPSGDQEWRKRAETMEKGRKEAAKREISRRIGRLICRGEEERAGADETEGGAAVRMTWECEWSQRKDDQR